MLGSCLVPFSTLQNESLCSDLWELTSIRLQWYNTKWERFFNQPPPHTQCWCSLGKTSSAPLRVEQNSYEADSHYSSAALQPLTCQGSVIEGMLMIDDDKSSRLKKVEIFLCINIYSAAQVPGSTVGRLSSAIWLHKYTEYMNVDQFTHISLWAATTCCLCATRPLRNQKSDRSEYMCRWFASL